MKNHNLLLNLIIGLLFIIGAGLIFIQPITNYLITSYHPNINAQTIQHNQHESGNFDFKQVKAVSPLSIINARFKANQNHYIGQIVAPDINVHLPIGIGVDNNVLMFGAGTMRPNMQMGQGNYALAGHHMKDNHVLFSPFYTKGYNHMPIYITDMHTVYEYQTYLRKIIPPTDVQVIDNTKQAILTLITCNDSGSMRLLTQAKLVKTMPIRQAPAKVLSALANNTNNHNVLKGY